MTERMLNDLIDQVTTSLLIANQYGANLTAERAKERARNIVGIFLPLLEERERALVEHLRAIAAASLKLGDAHRAIEVGADQVQRELEALLAGLSCEVCGRQIRDGEGAFEDGGEGVVLVTCGCCHEPKVKS